MPRSGDDEVPAKPSRVELDRAEEEVSPGGPLGRDPEPPRKRAVAQVAERYLNLCFDSEDLTALPLELRQQAERLLKSGAGAPEADDDAGDQPSWW